METICCACMCYGRKLYSIGETGFHDLYKQILNEIQIYDMSQLCVRVCWECKSLLRRFHRFKDQVKNSYQSLLHHKKLLSPPKPNQSNLQIQLVTSIAYPPFDVKIEGPDAEDSVERPDLGMEVEIKSELEEHCEPETFVNNLDLEMPRKRGRVPSVDKVHKEKLKKKLKEGKKSKFKKKLQLEKKRRRVSSDTSVSDVSVARQSVASDAEVKEESPDFKSEVDRLVENNVDKINTPKKKLKDTKKTKLKKKLHLEKKRRVSSDTSVSDVSVARQSVASDAEVKEELAKVDYELETELVIDNNVSKVVDILNGQVDKAVRKRSHKENLPDKPQCVECGKMFSSKKTYRYHLNVLHKGQNRYPCPRCGKIYQWKSNLGRHMRSHRARDSGELYCETCDKRFASVATYRQHLRVSRQHVSESEFRFMCNECGMKFVNKTRLRDHIDWEHLKKIKFKCQMCNKPFKCHTSLYVHMQNVHRNKEKKDNLCHVCGKSYQNAAKLKYHIVAMHTSETPYQCAQCSAAFGWYSSLYRHVREVHYKMKLQPKRAKKVKKLGSEILPSLVPQTHNAMQPGPA